MSSSSDEKSRSRKLPVSLHVDILLSSGLVSVLFRLVLLCSPAEDSERVRVSPDFLRFGGCNVPNFLFSGSVMLLPSILVIQSITFWRLCFLSRSSFRRRKDSRLLSERFSNSNCNFLRLNNESILNNEIIGRNIIFNRMKRGRTAQISIVRIGAGQIESYLCNDGHV